MNGGRAARALSLTPRFLARECLCWGVHGEIGWCNAFGV